MSAERTFIVGVPKLELVEEIEAPTAGDAVHRLLDSTSGVFEEKTDSVPFGEIFGEMAPSTIAWVIDTKDDSVTRFKLVLGWDKTTESIN
jgi:hypothetical protein